MKIVLDLTQLVAEGRLTEAQSQELQALARPATGLLAINILMAFGVFAIAGGVMLLLPTIATAIALGVVLAGAGVAIALGVGPQWSLLGTAVTIEGALITSAGIIAWFERLGAQPLSITLAGGIVVAIAIGLWRYNLRSPRAAAA
jgi:hypothetical protein